MPKKKRTKTINPTDEGKQYSIEDFAERDKARIIEVNKENRII